MSFKLISLSKVEARVHVVCDFGKDNQEWFVDMLNPGSLGSITATNKKGDRCSIGMFRTRDGVNMDPDYAKLRKAVELLRL